MAMRMSGNRGGNRPHEPGHWEGDSDDEEYDGLDEPWHDWEEPPPEEFQGPKLTREGPLERHPPFAQAYPTALLYLVLAAATAVHCQGLHDLSASGRAVFQDGQWWRLASGVLAHAGVEHLFANTALFLVFGWYLRAYYGLAVFPGLALALGAATHALTIACYGPEVRLVGASGMIYAMAALWIALYMRYEVSCNPGHRLLRAAGFSLVFLAPTAFVPEVSYLAHAYGFLLGLLTGVLLGPYLKPARPRADRAEVAGQGPSLYRET